MLRQKIHPVRIFISPHCVYLCVRIYIFFTGLTIIKTLKPPMQKGLVGVEVLQTGAFLGTENTGRVIRRTENSYRYSIQLFAN